MTRTRKRGSFAAAAVILALSAGAAAATFAPHLVNPKIWIADTLHVVPGDFTLGQLIELMGAVEADDLARVEAILREAGWEPGTPAFLLAR